MGQPEPFQGDLPPQVDARLLRTSDLIDLRLEAPGCALEPGASGMELVAGADARLVIHFPPLPNRASRHVAAGASPAGGSGGRGPEKPDELETAIEAPYRFIVSPSGLGSFTHSSEPVGPVAAVPSIALRDVRNHPSMRVLACQPEYYANSWRWFVDMSLALTSALWPFVRLSVARYQPQSIPGSTGSGWRVLIEEHELLDADPAAPGRDPVPVPRLIYADTVAP